MRAMVFERVWHPLRVVLLALAALMAFAGAARALEIEVRGDRMILSGPVVSGDFEKMRRTVERSPAVRLVVLRESPGGLLREALDMARFIRNRTMDTAVSGRCASACAIIFLGGVERSTTTEFPANRTYVAFHGGYIDGKNVMGYDPGIATTLQLYTNARIDSILMLRWMQLPQKGLVYFFDPARYDKPPRTTVFLCEGRSDNQDRGCERYPEFDAYRAGILTNRRAVAL